MVLQVMAQGSPLDPNWVPAPLEFPDTQGPLRVAVFKRHGAFDADPSVAAAIDQAAHWLERAGCSVELVEPPHFEEGADMWRQMVMDNMRRGGLPAVDAMGDAGVQSALHGYLAGLPALDRDQTLEMQARRFAICRDWAVFFDRYPVLLMPVCWPRQFAVDADNGVAEQVHALLRALAPMLGTAMMGLAGLAVPTGIVNGLPIGIQLATWRLREDLALRAGELIERAAGFSALDHLPETANRAGD